LFDGVNCLVAVDGCPYAKIGDTAYEDIGGNSYYFCQDCRSDKRLKTGIETIVDAVDTLLKIPVREFDWNSSYYYYDKFTQTGKIHSIGVIAQELLDVVPFVVHEDSKGYYWVSYTKLNALLIEGVKEQQRSIYEINAQIEELMKIVNDGK
jgi:hypothetical protein